MRIPLAYLAASIFCAAVTGCVSAPVEAEPTCPGARRILSSVDDLKTQLAQLSKRLEKLERPQPPEARPEQAGVQNLEALLRNIVREELRASPAGTDTAPMAALLRNIIREELRASRSRPGVPSQAEIRDTLGIDDSLARKVVAVYEDVGRVVRDGMMAWRGDPDQMHQLMESARRRREEALARLLSPEQLNKLAELEWGMFGPFGMPGGRPPGPPPQPPEPAVPPQQDGGAPKPAGGDAF